MALDSASLEASKGDSAGWVNEDIAILDRAVDQVGNMGRRDYWWRWNRYASLRDWSAEEMAVALVIGKGEVGSVFGIDRIVSDLVDLAKSIDGRSQTSAPGPA